MTQNIDRVAKRSRVLLLTDPVLSVTNLELRAFGAHRFNTVTDLGECACLLCRAKSKRLCDAIKKFNNLLLFIIYFIKPLHHRLNAYFAIFSEFVTHLFEEFFLIFKRSLGTLSLIK